MAEQIKSSPKNQISIEAYAKIKEKQTKSKLKLHFPLIVRAILCVPLVMLIFLIVYFLFYIRFVAEH